MGVGGGTSPSVRAPDTTGDKGRISDCCDEDSDIEKDRFESISVSKEATVEAEDDRCKDGGFRYERLPLDDDGLWYNPRLGSRERACAANCGWEEADDARAMWSRGLGRFSLLMSIGAGMKGDEV